MHTEIWKALFSKLALWFELKVALMCQKETLLTFFWTLWPLFYVDKAICVWLFFVNKGGDFILCWFPWGGYDLFQEQIQY